MKNRTNSIAKKLLCVVSLFAVTFLITVKTSAAPGDLDTTFGTGGKVTTNIPPNAFEAFDVAIQSDGKIVVGGSSFAPSLSFRFAVTRYNPDGSLDSNFGTGGISITQFFGSFPSSSVTAIAIQSDGKIIEPDPQYFTGFALARYNSNGTLDTTFDTDGRVETQLGLVGVINDIIIQPDGKIIAVGSAQGDPTGPADTVLARYNPNGSLDSSFGTRW